MRDNQHQLNTTSGLTLSSSDSESILEAFAFPVRYLFKLYETAVMENEIQEITVLPSKGRAAWSRSDIGRKVVVKDPITSEFGFQELPVSERKSSEKFENSLKFEVISRHDQSVG